MYNTAVLLHEIADLTLQASSLPQDHWWQITGLCLNQNLHMVSNTTKVTNLNTEIAILTPISF